MYKKLTALSLALGLALTAAGCTSKDGADNDPTSSKSQGGSGSQDAVNSFSAAPEGTDTGGWDSEKHPDRMGASSNDFLLSTEYSVWAAGQAWYISGGTWDEGATISISVAAVPEGEIDAAALEESASDESDSSFTVTAGDDGTFDAAVNVPEDTAPGSYIVTASDDESGTGQGQIIQVVAPE